MLDNEATTFAPFCFNSFNSSCNGSNTCCNYLGVSQNVWNYILIPAAVCEMIEKLERAYAVVEWILYHLPEYDQLPSQITTQDLGQLAELNRVFLQDCSLLNFCQNSGKFLTCLEHVTDPTQLNLVNLLKNLKQSKLLQQ